VEFKVQGLERFGYRRLKQTV